MKVHRNRLALSIVAALCLSGTLVAQASATDAVQSTAQNASTQKHKKKNRQAAAQMATVTVTGYRQSLQKALDIKRNADSIVDAISAEDIGKFPDTNAAESLSHLPGITVDRQFGEGEKVSINGTDPALNRVLINGQTIASGDWGGNPTDTSGRTFNYTLLSPEIIGLMEVYKSPQARIDEGSIGGTVIIHTRKPLDLPANTLRGSVGYEYNDRSAKGNPRGSILYSWKNDDDTFGNLVTITHDKETLYRAGIEFFGYTTGSGIPGTATVNGSGDVATAKLPAGINSSFFQQVRQRNGIQDALEWRPNKRNEFNLTGIYIKGKYNNFSESRYVCPACNNDRAKITDLTLNNGYITRATVSADTGNGQPYAQLDTNYRESTVTTKSINLRHDYFGDKWTLTSQIGYTRASGGKNPEYLMKYLLQSGGYNFAYDGTHTAVNYDNGAASNWGLAGSPAGLPAGSTDPGAMQAGGIYYSVSKDQERYAQFDADRDLDWGPLSELRMGVKFIDHFNGNSAYGNRINTTNAVLLSDFDTIHTPSGLWNGLHASGDLTSWTGVAKGAVIDYLKSLPQGPNHIDYGSSFGVREITKDLYAQVDFESGNLKGNLGVRYVDTMDKSEYWLSTNGSAYRPAASKQHYYKPLPSLNLIYNLSSDKILRFSASKVIARPRYSQMAGAFSRDDQKLTAGGGNPDLKPYESNNLDFSAEWYFQPNSLLSAELFYRDISNYIVNTTNDQQLYDPLTGQVETYQVSSPVNARNAKVRGISLLYQQDLGLGFGIQTNYTYAHASTASDYNMPYLSRDSFNVIPYYENGRWSARINYSWRSRYFNQIGRLNSNVYADAYKELDVTASYQATDWMSVNLSATNLLDSTYYWYNDVKYAPIGIYKNGRVYTVNLDFKF